MMSINVLIGVMMSAHEHNWVYTEKLVTGVLIKYYACSTKSCYRHQWIAYDMKVHDRNQFEGKYLVGTIT